MDMTDKEKLDALRLTLESRKVTYCALAKMKADQLVRMAGLIAGHAASQDLAGLVHALSTVDPELSKRCLELYEIKQFLEVLDEGE